MPVVFNKANYLGSGDNVQYTKRGTLWGAVVIMQLLKEHLDYKYLCGFLFGSMLQSLLEISQTLANYFKMSGLTNAYTSLNLWGF